MMSVLETGRLSQRLFSAKEENEYHPLIPIVKEFYLLLCSISRFKSAAFLWEPSEAKKVIDRLHAARSGVMGGGVREIPVLCPF